MPKSMRKPGRVCQVCGGDPRSKLLPAALVRPAIATLILQQLGRWDEEGFICETDLQAFRNKYVEAIIVEEKGEITQLDEEVLESLREHEILASNPTAELESKATFGQRLADRIATFGGSWYFILSFGAVLFAWMVLNSFVLVSRPFDPYPYILLNLVLSSLAALQAPVIMMSQNRQEIRDRSRADHDYQVNLKAELEIRHLHQKVDHLLSHQWQRMIEIQEIQMELIQEMKARR